MAESRRDGFGTVLGLLTFLGGMGLVVTTFVLAQGMFVVSPEEALGIQPGEVLDINGVVARGVTIVLRILLLIVMAGIGSLIASRGIKLYILSGSRVDLPTAKEGSGRDDRI